MVNLASETEKEVSALRVVGCDVDFSLFSDFRDGVGVKDFKEQLQRLSAHVSDAESVEIMLYPQLETKWASRVRIKMVCKGGR